ncbi:unnamed protein product [Arctogadus glacialis]
MSRWTPGGPPQPRRDLSRSAWTWTSRPSHRKDWGRYECVVQLRGIEDISTPLDPALIRTNWGKTGVGGDGGGEHMSPPPPLTSSSQPLPGVPATLLKLLGSDTSSENTEGQNPAPEANL